MMTVESADLERLADQLPPEDYVTTLLKVRGETYLSVTPRADAERHVEVFVARMENGEPTYWYRVGTPAPICPVTTPGAAAARIAGSFGAAM